jgi:hypothetical protein
MLIRLFFGAIIYGSNQQSPFLQTMRHSVETRTGQRFAGKKADATSQYLKRLSLPTVKKM